jgi:large conductance mechanosensitive channel
MVKIINKIRDEEPKPTPPTPENIVLLREIRDILKK